MVDEELMLYKHLGEMQQSMQNGGKMSHISDMQWEHFPVATSSDYGCVVTILRSTCVLTTLRGSAACTVLIAPNGASHASSMSS